MASSMRKPDTEGKKKEPRPFFLLLVPTSFSGFLVPRTVDLRAVYFDSGG